MKQAVLLIVDVGYSMDEAFSETCSRARISFECCKLTIQQKLFNNSTHEIGLMLFGDNDTDDGNSLMLQDIDKPCVDLVRKIEQLSKAQFENTRAGGDIFSAINYGIGVIDKHCAKRKVNKRMFLFTNGMGKTDYDLREMKDLSNKIEGVGIKLNIIPIDFMTSYNCSTNELEGEMMLDPMQEENAQRLIKLKELKTDNIQIFPASLAIELYKKFRKRDTNPVARFKGTLQFAPGLEAQVSAYKAIRRQKLKSLARYDASVEFDPKISATKDVVVETNYIVQGDETGSIVDKESIINAYYYGPQLVPIPTILEAGSKIFEDKHLRLLGFIDKAKVPRHCLMSEVDLVVPGEDTISRKLFSAFIYSMISLNKYAVARFVARNSKVGVTPRMVVLIPYRSTEKQMFYLIELPTVEDVRDYPYNTLKHSTEKQRELVRNLVNSMSLYNKDGEQFEEELKMENTFNPIRQYFYQTIFYRALNTDATDIPPLDPVIRNYISPQISKYEANAGLSKQVKKEFKLVKKINLQEKNDKKKAIMWKDVLSELTKEQNANEKQIVEETAEIEEQDFGKPAFKFSAEDEEDGIRFNPSDPVTSFKKMVTYNREDLVELALKQMNQYIKQKVTFAISPQALRHLYDCASQLRNACVTEQEHRYWDQWFNDLSRTNNAFYSYLRGQGLSLIEGDVMELYKPLGPHIQIEELICDLD